MTSSADISCRDRVSYLEKSSYSNNQRYPIDLHYQEDIIRSRSM